MATKAEVATYAGSALSIGSASPHYFFGLTLDQWSLLGIWVGIFTALCGLAIQWYFKQQHLNLARRRAAVPVDEDEG